MIDHARARGTQAERAQHAGRAEQRQKKKQQAEPLLSLSLSRARARAPRTPTHALLSPRRPRDHDCVLHAQLVGRQALQHPRADLGIARQELGDLCWVLGVLGVRRACCCWVRACVVGGGVGGRLRCMHARVNVLMTQQTHDSPPHTHNAPRTHACTHATHTSQFCVTGTPRRTQPP